MEKSVEKQKGGGSTFSMKRWRPYCSGLNLAVLKLYH